MLDWAARIDDLMDRLRREHSVDDRMAVEVLLSALVNCPRTASPWLVLETKWWDRNCEDAWFSFGEQWNPWSLPRLRGRGPWREVEMRTMEWLDNPSDEHLFVEPDYEKYPRFQYLTHGHAVLMRCLRIRVRMTRADDPLGGLDKYNRDRRSDELNTAARQVLEDRIQARPTDPPRFIQPPNFLYHVELLQRLAPWYWDWGLLVRCFGMLAVRHAYLLGRTETNAEDDHIMARVLHDSIPPWIAKALRAMLQGPVRLKTLEIEMNLIETTRRSGHGCYKELRRLRDNGIIEWHSHRQSWGLQERHRQGIINVLTRYSFGADRAPRPPLEGAPHNASRPNVKPS